MTDWNITEDIARKVLTVIDAGLVYGMGKPELGQMCVEAAVCYAMGLPHGDDPACVAPSLRRLKIGLNDRAWSSDKARAKGLRRLGLAQLGSKGHLDEAEFRRRLVDYALRVTTPQALRSAASVHKDPKHKQALLEAASRCEREASLEAALAGKKIAASASASASADAASAAAYAADAAAYAAFASAASAYAAFASAAAYAASAKKTARDKSLEDYAEAVVQILIEMKAPGCRWLSLTEEQVAA